MNKRFGIIAVCVMACILFLGCTSRMAKASTRGPVRGLYFDVVKSQNLSFMENMMNNGKPVGINTYVLDMQPYLGKNLSVGLNRARINPAVVKMLNDNGMFTAARVVCFQYGLTSIPAPEAYLQALDKVIEDACKAGFDEVQLDYIRFADQRMPYTREQKYAYIATILRRAKNITDKYDVILTADVFGRIVYHPHDRIGQRVEEMAPYIQIMYPMLYPSHFTESPKRMGDPAFTINEGVGKSVERLKGTGVRTIPWIQAFAYNLGYSRMNLTDYIAAQIDAAENGPANGWVAWNAHGRYEPLFDALRILIRAGTVSGP